MTILNIDAPIPEECVQEIRKLNHIEAVYSIHL